MNVGDHWTTEPIVMRTAPPRLHDTPHFVYRCFDAAGQLLYVGCSIDTDARLAKHRRTAMWAGDLANVTIERYPTRRLGLAAERVAIEDEAPLHNVQYNVAPQERGPWTAVSADADRELLRLYRISGRISAKRGAA